MQAIAAILLAPMLAASGVGTDLYADDEVPEVAPTEDSSAEVEASGPGLEIEVSTDDRGVFMREQLPGPGFEDDPELDVADGPLGEDTEPEQAQAEPTALPSPEEAAAPAGLAVLGAAAYAALRWRYLLSGLFAPLYSRLSRDELLENEARQQLHELITEEPGLSTQELCDRIGAGWGNTVYHLQRLEQAGFVTSEKQGHHRRFYKNGDVEPDEIEALGVLKNDNASKIARYLVAEPGANQTDVCEALDISPSLAHKWISRLEEQDLVESEREWRSKHYEPDDRLATLVERAA
jgi:DNA-binding MarR family transcriptional regulator